MDPRLVIIGLCMAILPAAVGLNHLRVQMDLNNNYVAVQGRVTSVQSQCVMISKDTHTRSVEMPCDTAANTVARGGDWQDAKVEAHTTINYSYYADADHRYHQGRLGVFKSREYAPSTGSTVKIYVRKTDPDISRYGEKLAGQSQLPS